VRFAACEKRTIGFSLKNGGGRVPGENYNALDERNMGEEGNEGIVNSMGVTP